jgi:hypothetical protein
MSDGMAHARAREMVTEKDCESGADFGTDETVEQRVLATEVARLQILRQKFGNVPLSFRARDIGNEILGSRRADARGIAAILVDLCELDRAKDRSILDMWPPDLMSLLYTRRFQRNDTRSFEDLVEELDKASQPASGIRRVLSKLSIG